MKIEIQQSIKTKTSYIFHICSDSDEKNLTKMGFSKEEASYLSSKVEKDKKIEVYTIHLLNDRYKGIVFIPEKIEANDAEKIRIAGSKIASIIKSNQQKNVYIQNHHKISSAAIACIEGIALASYEFNKYFSDKKNNITLETIIVSGNVVKKDIDALKNIIHGTYISRNLVNEPVQYLTATRLSKEIEKLSKEAGFRFEYFGKKKIESLKMGGLLGVNKGSIEQPTFNILEWKPSKCKNKKPIIFIGKGVVYDTGGSSLKTSPGMEKMKGDMAGAAAVIGSIYAIAKNKVPYHVIGLIPATDNRIDNTSIVPGDILTMYSGKTVEVLNTDAEGRLILADALHYASKFKPELVIDLATLTGAAVAAIGELGIVGMEKNAEKEFNLLEKSGWSVYERIVKFPLWDEYGDMIKSNIADIKNIGGPLAGSITAGKFLEHFISYPWIHLDLSNALTDRNQHYRTATGTGAGTRLLIEFINQKIKA
jgi:leucyl aminopeptidase